MTRRIFSMLMISLVVAFAMPQISTARDSDVPLRFFAMRDGLLRQRSLLQNQKADLNQRLLQMHKMLTDINNLLYSNSLESERYTELSIARSRLLVVMNDMQKRLDTIEKDLMNNNRDLSNIEYYIQRFACSR